eukprot:scaffold93971_cov27-Tisochrysis_lutea.AAC.1
MASPFSRLRFMSHNLSSYASKPSRVAEGDGKGRKDAARSRTSSNRTACRMRSATSSFGRPAVSHEANAAHSVGPWAWAWPAVSATTVPASRHRSEHQQTSLHPLQRSGCSAPAGARSRQCQQTAAAAPSSGVSASGASETSLSPARMSRVATTPSPPSPERRTLSGQPRSETSAATDSASPARAMREARAPTTTEPPEIGEVIMRPA